MWYTIEMKIITKQLKLLWIAVKEGGGGMMKRRKQEKMAENKDNLSMAENRDNLSTDMNMTLEQFIKLLPDEHRETVLEIAEYNLMDIQGYSGTIIEIERNYTLAVDIIKAVMEKDEK